MIQVTSREFRSNQASIFARADAGEQVVIRRRGKQAYMLMPVSDDDFIVSPDLHNRILAADKQHKEGSALRFDNREEMINWLDNL